MENLVETLMCKKCYRHLSSKNQSGYCGYHYSKAIQSGVKRPQFSNENSGRWKGGEYISNDGYLVVKGEDGELTDAGRQKYYRKHIKVIEEAIGRKLSTAKGGLGEAVHHIDGDKLNNDLVNLYLCRNAADHRNLHVSLERVAFQLVKNGVILFDKDTGEYQLCQ